MRNKIEGDRRVVNDPTANEAVFGRPDLRVVEPDESPTIRGSYIKPPVPIFTQARIDKQIHGIKKQRIEGGVNHAEYRGEVDRLRSLRQEFSGKQDQEAIIFQSIMPISDATLRRESPRVVEINNEIGKIRQEAKRGHIGMGASRKKINALKQERNQLMQQFTQEGGEIHDSRK